MFSKFAASLANQRSPTSELCIVSVDQTPARAMAYPEVA